MKAFAPVLVALAAGAKAEADPQFLTYGGIRSVIPTTYGYGLGYNTFNRGVVAIGKREAEAEADPQFLTYGGIRSVIPSAYGYGLGYNTFNRGVVAIGKREAEAEPEADAQLLLGNRFGYTGLGYNAWGLNAAYSPYSRVVALGKREAEAEADPQLLLNGWGVSPYVGSHVAAVSPYMHSAVAAPLAAGYKRIVAIGKREAEAEPEADAQLLLGNRFGYTGLGYNAWGLNAAYSPYNRVVRFGKREAEAEADPQLLLNGWGARPYAYSAGYPWGSSIYGINRFY